MAFITAASAPVVPASPAPLTPSGLVVQGTGCSDRVEGRQHVGARHRVVHEGAGQELAVAGRTPRLPQRLADALGDAAMHLALHQHRVEDLADIVHRGVARDLDRAGLGIDLDLGDVAAVGEVAAGPRPALVSSVGADLALGGDARSSIRPMRRSVPATRKRAGLDSRCRPRPLRAGARPARLPLAMHQLDGLQPIAMPAIVVERERDAAGAVARSNTSVSPWMRCGRCLDRRRAARRRSAR